MADRKRRPGSRVGIMPCTVEGCEKLIKARGWCDAHYAIWRKRGSPTARLQGQVVDGRRICPGCGIDKLLEDYTPGATGRCRRCVADNMRERRLTLPPEPYNPVSGRKKQRVWRQRHPEESRAAAMAYRVRKIASTVEVFDPLEVFQRDGWTCGICTDAIDPQLRYPDPMSVSLDHVIPLSRGGEHSRENSQASHLVCNLRKHDKVA